jgi:hypothetical protein
MASIISHAAAGAALSFAFAPDGAPARYPGSRRHTVWVGINAPMFGRDVAPPRGYLRSHRLGCGSGRSKDAGYPAPLLRPLPRNFEGVTAHAVTPFLSVGLLEASVHETGDILPQNL